MENNVENILFELKRKKILNDDYCNLNSVEITPYMEGSNRILDEMIIFVENLI